MIAVLQVMTVSEIFAKQLMQISGVSPDKVVVILEKFPTPKRYRLKEVLFFKTLLFYF